MDFQDLIANDPNGFLAGQLLVAMPGIGDERFERTVIRIVNHSDAGAVGFVLNRPADIDIDDLLARAGVDADARGRADPEVQRSPLEVVHGGPVEDSRGFVLHSPDYGSDGTIRLEDDLALTSTLDVLRAVARGSGPRRAVLALGYAGWAAGQIEDELRENVWLTIDAQTDLIFEVPSADRYATALGLMGIEPGALSGVAGNA